MASLLPYSDSVETIPADESQDIDRIVEIMRSTLRQHLEKSGRLTSDVHAKPHACVLAEFQVAGGLPPEVAQGLFARPGLYPAFVRFSNTAPWFQPDAVPDGRGLAVQVDLRGERSPFASSDVATQDFVMANNSTFVAANVKGLLELEEARQRAGDNPLMFAATLALSHKNPLDWNWRGIQAAASVATQLPKHPASYTYFSMAPIRFGDFVAKYRVLPDAELSPSAIESTASFATQRDAMRRLLEETLRERELRFAFQVQLRTSSDMPIEDATVEWRESDSPYRTVAALVISRQDLAATAEEEDRVRRSFSVWNALPEHRPLGGINRVRRRVYAESSAWRRQADAPG
ncbi:MAG TPA: catalase family protein [Pirellulaceae bacterium]|jgi:hypothetical protein|nr:catalase family protein [Pirellulaceae bacterium]